MDFASSGCDRMFQVVSESGRIQSAPDGGMAAACGAGIQEGKFLPAHAYAKAAYGQTSRTHCRLPARYRNARFARGYKLAEHSEECSSLFGVTKTAFNSWLTSDQAGTNDTYLSAHTKTDRTGLTGTSLDSCSSCATTSGSWGRSSCTKPKLRNSHALRAYARATRHLVGQAFATRPYPSRARKPRNSLHRAAFCLLVAVCLPSSVSAAQLPLATFVQLAATCAPHVAVETLAAVARTESALDPLTLHDNATGRSYHPATPADAIALGIELATVARHSVDLGLMQINSANLSRLGLTLADAFDPCRNLAAADRLLVAGYAAPPSGEDPQPAVRQALSRYNTGDPARGLANGYVTRVQASAELVVPALRLRGEPAPDQPGPLGGAPVTAQSLPPPPPSWDVYGQARARTQATLVYDAASQPSPPALPLAPAPSGPVPLRRLPQTEATADAR